jgi:hypothetical protein
MRGPPVHDVGESRHEAVDSDAATCNHAIHEFFEYTFRSRFLVAPLTARGQRVECESMNAASIQGGVFVGAAESGRR